MTEQRPYQRVLPRLFAGLRQLLYPPEFRIAAQPWPAELVKAAARLDSIGDEGTQGAAGIDAGGADDGFLAEIGTGLWRLRRKMLDPGTERPREEMRRAFRHLESVWDVLKEAGVEIQDHTDALFDSGHSLKVIAFQPVASVTRERVMETIKPSIYVGSRRIQMGEVIVATPQESRAGQNPTAPPAVTEDS